MGYTTKFEGALTVEPPLAGVHFAYLERFSDTRRVKRDATAVRSVRDPLREAVGLPPGTEGEHCVALRTSRRLVHDPTVVDFNAPPSTQPGLWCQWVPNEAGTAIIWNGGEKFYHYVEWLEYLISHFLKPWGYRLDGEVRWRGERFFDQGVIRVVDSVVETRELLWA